MPDQCYSIILSTGETVTSRMSEEPTPEVVKALEQLVNAARQRFGDLPTPLDNCPCGEGHNLNWRVQAVRANQRAPEQRAGLYREGGGAASEGHQPNAGQQGE